MPEKNNSSDNTEIKTEKKWKYNVSEEEKQRRLETFAKGRIAKGQSPSPERKAKMLDAMQRAKKAKAKKPNEFELTITPIFIKNKEATTQIVVNRGGARSGKSVSIIQLLLERFFSYPKRQILILRKTLPALRVSTLKVMEEMVYAMGVKHLIREEKIALNWHNAFNGSLIHFGGLDKPVKIRSSDWNDVFLEEATEFSYDDFSILKTRLSTPILGENAPRNQMFLAFNPEDESCWIKEKVIDGPEDCTEIVSTYKDNPFLSEEYKKILEDLINQDLNHYRVYALGEWGKLEDVIFSNWDTVKKLPDDNDVSKIFYGIDFGYNHPSTLVKIMSRDKDLFVEELIYKSGLTNTDFAEEIKNILPLAHKRNCRIYCDNAEPDRIEELRRDGLKVVAARKGPHSVKDGIDFLKRKKIHILESSSNLIKELRVYSWKKDKRGNAIDEPVSYLDDAISSLRYGVWSELGGSSGPKIWSLE